MSRFFPAAALALLAVNLPAAYAQTAPRSQHNAFPAGVIEGRVLDAEGGTIAPTLPMVVLVDGGTASSSEIVAGALRDRGRAVVVGEKTFGKGVFQNVQALENGGVLDLTVGSYYLPKGENLAHNGIVPAVRVRDDSHTRRDEAMATALRVLAPLAARRR